LNNPPGINFFDKKSKIKNSEGIIPQRKRINLYCPLKYFEIAIPSPEKRIERAAISEIRNSIENGNTNGKILIDATWKRAEIKEVSIPPKSQKRDSSSMDFLKFMRPPNIFLNLKSNIYFFLKVPWDLQNHINILVQ